MSRQPLSAEASTRLRETLSARPDVSRAFVVDRGEDELVAIELDDVAVDIEEYKAAVHELMAAVAGALGADARGRAMACGPKATIGPTVRHGVLVYERSSP